jgi:hypothetical protein
MKRPTMDWEKTLAKDKGHESRIPKLLWKLNNNKQLTQLSITKFLNRYFIKNINGK